MKKSSFTLLIMLTSCIVFSQGVAINEDGAAPNASAMLEVTSTEKGVLIPRMILKQRDAIQEPAQGLLIYQSNGTPGFYYNAGTPSLPDWQMVGNNAGTFSYWTGSGNNIYFNEGNVGIGTASTNALLHTRGTGQGEGNLLFEGLYNFLDPGDPPVENSGTRMMWYPDKAAFRVGRVTGSHWNKENIGNHSMAMGFDTKADGYGSTAMGWSTLASGDYSTAMGTFTTASGNRSTAMGTYTIASGNRSTAIGMYTVAMGTASTAIGRNVTAPSFVETTIGAWNTEYTSYNVDAWVPSERLFVIGNGTSNSSRSNAMTVLKSGNIGIGTDMPGNNRLRVISSASGSGGTTGYFENEHASGIALRAVTDSDDGTILVTQHGEGYAMRLDGYDPDWFVAMIVKGRQVGINTNNLGSFNLAVNGSAAKTGGGNWSTLSDARLKTINGNYTKGLHEIVALQAVNFNYVEDNPYGFDPESEQIGFIAQEVREIFPEAVSTGDDGYLDFNMHAINVALVNAIKELKLENDELKAENEKLRSTDDQLISRIERLEMLIASFSENQ